jgi:hypothetical protein
MSALDDTNFETLFWSLMDDLEDIPHPMATDLWEKYEVAGMELDGDENG